MKKVNPIYYFVPFLYVALIDLFVFLQWREPLMQFFSDNDFINKERLVRKKETSTTDKSVSKTKKENNAVAKKKRTQKSKFEKQIGAIEIKIAKKVKDEGQTIKTNSATIYCYDLCVSINEKQDIFWIGNDGKKENISLRTVSYDQKSVTLLLSNGAKILFDNQGDEVVVAGEHKDSGMVYIKIAARDEGELVGLPGDALFFANVKGQQTILSQSNSDIGFKSLAVVCGVSQKMCARICEAGGLSNWYAMAAKYDNIEDMSVLYSQFRLRSYRGWLVGRYNRTTGMWLDGNGRDYISSDLINSFVSEAYDRREPFRAIDLVDKQHIFSYDLVNGQRYENLHVAKEVSSLPSSLFFGQMRENFEQNKKEAHEVLSQIRSAKQTKDFAFFSNPYLIEMTVLFGNEQDMKELISLLPLLKEEQNPSYLIGGIAHGIYLFKLYPEQDNLIKEALQEAINRLVHHISFDIDFACITKEGKVLTPLTIRAAMALRDAALLGIAPQYSELASILFSCYLQNADEYGVADEAIWFIDNGKVSPNKKLLPESIYPWIKGEGCFPVVQRFVSSNSGDIFCYHRSRSLNIQEWGNTLSLNFIHYHIGGEQQYALTVLNNFMVKGVRPFERVSMWTNFSWPADRGYELWRIGYAYWEDDRLITAMLRHRSIQENFTISWE